MRAVFISDFQKVHLARLEKMAKMESQVSQESVEREVNKGLLVNLVLWAQLGQ
jgi:hypothetical protein